MALVVGGVAVCFANHSQHGKPDPYKIRNIMPGQADATERSAVHENKPIVTAPSRAMVLSVWLRDLIISLAISCFIIIFLYQPVKVEGTSMMPSLEDQERIFVNKFVYRLEPIERGDIIVFRYPRDPSKSFIKRVIGLAGDHIQIDAGRVFVNGKPIDEDYVPRAYEDERSYAEVVVPADSYFVLGDQQPVE